MKTICRIFLWISVLLQASFADEVPELILIPGASIYKNTEYLLLLSSRQNGGASLVDVAIVVREVGEMASHDSPIIEIWDGKAFVASFKSALVTVDLLPKALQYKVRATDLTYYFRVNKECLNCSWIAVKSGDRALMIRMKDWPVSIN